MTGKPNSWLCPTPQDRARISDANDRVRMIRTVGSAAVGVALLAVTPWMGWWTFVLFGCSVLNFLTVERRMARSLRPERVSMSAIAVTLGLIGTGVSLSGGPRSPALSWMVLPAGMVAARFRPQVVIAGMAVTLAAILLVTLGVNSAATIENPSTVISTIALLIAVVSIVWALETAELHQRGEATLDPLTGLANRRRLADELPSTWAKATEEHPARLLLFDLDGFKAYNDTFGHREGDLLLVRLAQAFQVAVGRAGRAYRLGGDEFCALLWQDTSDELVAACVRALSAAGEGFSITSSYGSVIAPAETADPDLAMELADERMYGYKDSSRASAGRQTRDLALQVVAVHEPALHQHASHVAELTEAVARRMGMHGQELTDAVRAAELHDIGKVAIPFSILHKAGPLDAQEWEIVHRHPTIGARVLGAAPALANVAELVAATHERYDGRGYPRGLVGEAIPLASRIVFVCDSFDAMVSERPFGEARSEEEALAELRRCAGGQFDPRVVEVFFDEHRARQAARLIAEQPRSEQSARGRGGARGRSLRGRGRAKAPGTAAPGGARSA